MKKHLSTIILGLIFLVGLSVLLYPTVADYVNSRSQSRAIAQYIEKTESIYACGGLANSPSFTQLLSNITELPIQVFEDTESTGLGAWMSGAVATGLYESFEAAFKAARENDPLKRIEVQQEALETYRAKKQAYSQTYHAKA